MKIVFSISKIAKEQVETDKLSPQVMGERQTHDLHTS